MTPQQVIAQINQVIIANGNKEITANVLNPVLRSIVNALNDKIGDLSQLGTNDTSSLVAAINEILNSQGQGDELTIFNGSNNPNEIPPVGTFAVTNYYLQTVEGVNIMLWQYNGIEWVKIAGQNIKANSIFIPIDDWQSDLESQILSYIASNGINVSGEEVTYLYGLKPIEATTNIGFQKYVWTWMSGRGEFTSASQSDLFFIGNSVVSGNNQIFDLGEIQENSIESIVNISGPFTVSNDNANAFRATRNTQEMYYLYFGESELIGNNEYQTDADDFVLLSTIYPNDSADGVSQTYVDNADDAHLLEAKNYTDTGLEGKVDNSRVLTDVPANALFTDTVYNDTEISQRVTGVEQNKANDSEVVKQISVNGSTPKAPTNGLIDLTVEGGETVAYEDIIQIYSEGSEWNIVAGTAFNTASATEPKYGSFSIEGTNVPATGSVTFEAPGGSIPIGYLKYLQAWVNNKSEGTYHWVIQGTDEADTAQSFSIDSTIDPSNTSEYQLDNIDVPANDLKTVTRISFVSDTEGYDVLIDDVKIIANIGKEYVDEGLSKKQDKNTVNTLAEAKELNLKDGEYVYILGRETAGDGLIADKPFYFFADDVTPDNGGTVFSVNGGTLKAYTYGAVSPKWFGAKGDGVTDDSVAINAAKDWGDHVCLFGGTYKIDSTVNLDKEGLTLEIGLGARLLVNRGVTGVWVQKNSVNIIGYGTIECDKETPGDFTNTADIGIKLRNADGENFISKNRINGVTILNFYVSIQADIIYALTIKDVKTRHDFFGLQLNRQVWDENEGSSIGKPVTGLNIEGLVCAGAGNVYPIPAGSHAFNFYSVSDGKITKSATEWYDKGGLIRSTGTLEMDGHYLEYCNSGIEFITISSLTIKNPFTNGRSSYQGGIYMDYGFKISYGKGLLIGGRAFFNEGDYLLTHGTGGNWMVIDEPGVVDGGALCTDANREVYSFLNADEISLNGDLKIKGSSSLPLIYSFKDGGTEVLNPKGGIYNSNGSATGAFKIALPNFFTSTKLKFAVDVFSYETDKSFRILVSGYDNSVFNKWESVSVQIIGSSEAIDVPVRFGHDGVNTCLWIGDLTTVWASHTLKVKDFLASKVSETWLESWDISVVEAFDTVQTTKTNNFPYTNETKVKNLYKNVPTATDPNHAVNLGQMEAAINRTEKLISNTSQYTILATDVDKILKFTANNGEEIQLIYNESTLPDANKSIVAMSTGNNILIPTVGTGTVTFGAPAGSLLRTTGVNSLITLQPKGSVNDLSVWGTLEGEPIDVWQTVNLIGTSPSLSIEHRNKIVLIAATDSNVVIPTGVFSAGDRVIIFNPQNEIPITLDGSALTKFYAADGLSTTIKGGGRVELYFNTTDNAVVSGDLIVDFEVHKDNANGSTQYVYVSGGVLTVSATAPV